MSQNHNGTNVNTENGKSFGAMSLAYAMALQGFCPVFIDPKGDALPMQYSPDCSVMTTPADTLSEFAEDLLWTVESILSNRVGRGALFPYEGEQLFEDTELLDHAENVGLMVEDHNKSVFMFDESFADSEENLAFAWFAWGDTLPSYPVFPVRVIRIP